MPSPRVPYNQLARPGHPVRCVGKRHKTGEPCKKWAEHGTDRCKFHLGRKPIHGLRSKYHRYPEPGMQKKFEEFLTDEKGVYNLRPEIAHLRTIFSYLITQFESITAVHERFTLKSVNSHYEVFDKTTEESLVFNDEDKAKGTQSWLNRINSQLLIAIQDGTSGGSEKLNNDQKSLGSLKNGKFAGLFPLCIHAVTNLSKVLERQHKMEYGTRHTISFEGISQIINVLAITVKRYVTEEYITEHSATQARKRIGEVLKEVDFGDSSGGDRSADRAAGKKV